MTIKVEKRKADAAKPRKRPKAPARPPGDFNGICWIRTIRSSPEPSLRKKTGRGKAGRTTVFARLPHSWYSPRHTISLILGVNPDADS
jgi:hypothetical protein